MKKKFYIIGTIILVLALSIGCTNNQEDVKGNDEGVIVDKDNQDLDDEVDTTDEEKTAEDIMKDFADKVEKSLSDAGNFLEKNMDKLSQVEVDKMVSNLINKTEENVDKIREKIANMDKDQEIIDAFDDDLYLTQDQIDQMDNDELRKELDRLQAENYRLINLEGQYYPAVNYEGFKKYEDHVSDEIKDYIALKARDSNKPLALDGGLYISYEELADRIIETENYIKKYGEGDRYGEALEMYKNKLSMYLLGIPNTPITEENSDKIKDDLMESYKQTALISDSSTGFIVGKYINLIEKNNGVIDDEIKRHGEVLLEEANELIRAKK